MKRNLFGILALASVLMGLGVWAEPSRPAQPLPLPFPEARYQQMSAKSPFAVASASSTGTAAATPGFAAQLYVDGVAQIGKTDFVAIKSRDPDQQSAIFLAVGDSTPDGLKVDAVHWSVEMGKTTVDVSKGGEKATLVFDEATLAKNAGPATGAGPGQPGVRLPTLPGQGRPMGFPNGAPGQPGSQFNRNRVFPGQPMQPGVQGAPGMPNGVQVRRRVHMIQSGQ